VLVKPGSVPCEKCGRWNDRNRAERPVKSEDVKPRENGITSPVASNDSSVMEQIREMLSLHQESMAAQFTELKSSVESIKNSMEEFGQRIQAVETWIEEQAETIIALSGQ